MRFGLLLPTFVYNEERVKIVDRTLSALANTDVTGLERPLFKISYRESSFNYGPYVEKLQEKFEIEMRTDLDHSKLVNRQALTSLSGWVMLQDHPDVTHLMFLWDDWIVNSQWLQQLNALIQRHPTDTVAWSVFRSAFTEFHRIVGGDGTDVLMTMHDGTGCVTREEWIEYVALHGHPNAMDVAHAQLRPGNRWATSRDYIQNLGRHYDRGIGDVDCAIDFVGEG